MIQSRNYLFLVLLSACFSCDNRLDLFSRPDVAPREIVIPDQIIFGRGSHYHRLTRNQLFADSCNTCYYRSIPFLHTPLPSDKFEIARSLLLDVPPAIYHVQDMNFGCAGCDDIPPYLVEIRRNGRRHICRWDFDYKDVPHELRPYFERVRAVIKRL